MTVKSFDTQLLRKEKNSQDSYNFYFKKPKNFSYTAGQYIKMKLPIENPDDRGVTRYFTLSSSPTDSYLMITTRIIKSSFKKHLGKLKIGEKVHMRGPWGDFTLPTKPGKPLILLAGGIGMTPYHSILRFMAEKNVKIPITLYVSYKTPEDILYAEELEAIMAKHKNIKVITSITQPKGSDWVGETGRIDKEFLENHITTLSKNTYYVSGPDPMVFATEKNLIDLGVPKDQIQTDGFPGYRYD